jgi:hypothetical protein
VRTGRTGYQGDRRATRRQFSAEKSHRQSGRGEDSIAELCAAGDRPNLYYRWSKSGGWQKRLAGDTVRAATPDEVRIRAEASALKRWWPSSLENRLLKKVRSGLGRTVRDTRRREAGDHRLVEQSPLLVSHWRNSAFPGDLYRWHDRHSSGGPRP